DALQHLDALAQKRNIEPADFAKNWRLQLGSLGGGNHFIEVTADDHGDVWAFLHSGSRGIGNQIARRFIRIAQDLAKHKVSQLPDRDLVYLSRDAAAYDEYLDHLYWAQEFARLNREVMMDRVIDQIGRFMGEDVQRVDEVNCHHNYSQHEEHFGQDVLVTRKGAIAAHTGVRGLLPGPMGTASYVDRKSVV